jgi:AcrR family transcriptional regulator
LGDEGESVAVRKPRADAQRNRARLLDTAKAAFAEKGAGASLDEIARSAGVGAGTLYRHFPTRDALIAAVYHNETEQLVAAANRLADTQPPMTALREWLRLFVEYMVTKQGMYPALSAIVGGTSDLYSTSTAKVKQAVADLTDRAVASGDMRLECDALDLLRALAGVAHAASGPQGKQAALHMVEILVAGLQARR